MNRGGFRQVKDVKSSRPTSTTVQQCNNAVGRHVVQKTFQPEALSLYILAPVLGLVSSREAVRG